MGKKIFKGSHCIFPLHRAFSYSDINFSDTRKKRLDYNPNETAILKGIMQTEYWLKYGDLMVDQVDFFPSYLPKELDREEPFNFYYKALFWMISDLSDGYVEFAEKALIYKQLINKEEPEVDIQSLDDAEKKLNKVKYGDGLLEFGLDIEKKEKLKQENKLSYRFKQAGFEILKKYVSNINRAAFAILQKSDVYVTKIAPLKSDKYFDPQFEICLVILHLPNNGASRYNRIITVLQEMTCYQSISVKLNITLVSHSDKTTYEAYYTWKQAVKRREERTNKVNLMKRAKRDQHRMKKGRRPIGISKKDFKDYCKTSNKFCHVDEVKFTNLNIDRYLTHYVEDGSEEFDPGDLEREY